MGLFLFATWCTAIYRQRINANGFNAIWFILLKQKHDLNQCSNYSYINYRIFHLVKKTAHSVRTDPSSSRPTCPVFLVLAHVAHALAEHRLLIVLATWRLGPPSPLSPKLIPFPSCPRQKPTPISGTILMLSSSKMRTPNVYDNVSSSQLMTSMWSSSYIISNDNCDIIT